MKPVIKINFSDFWEGFKKEDNFFINLLSQQYTVELSEKPDFLIYSCYGNEYLKFKGIRIFYTAENIRPDFFGCDYAFSFDLINHPRHYRLPLYALYIQLWGQQENVLRIKSMEDIKKEWKLKNKFCCILISNPNAKKRINFFQKLNNVKKVDSGGRVLNNIGRSVENKLEFIKDYKFVFAFENSSHPGYTTEKLIEPCFAGSIPIYWGNPEINLDFNNKRFINYKSFSSDEQLIQHIIDIDNNDELAYEMLSQPIFSENKLPKFIQSDNILNFFNKIFRESKEITPVAVRKKHHLHLLNKRKTRIKSRIYFHLGLNFR